MPATANGRWVRAFVAWRNRLLSSPRFQAGSLRVPLVRRIGRRRAQRLFDTVAGFVASQWLRAALALDVLPLLARGPMPLSAVATHTGLAPGCARRLMEALCALRLCEELPDGAFTLGEDGAALAAQPGLVAMIRHHQLLAQDLADLPGLLKRGGGGRLARFWDYGAADPDTVQGYSALMAETQPAIAALVLDALAWRGATSLLDLGGGHGAFLRAVHARHPEAALTLFDRAEVLSGAPSCPNVGQVAGDLFAGPLPPPADIVTLVRICHDHDDAVLEALFARLACWLPPASRLVIAEPMAGSTPAGRSNAQYFHAYFLAMGRGRPRTPETYRAMLRAAGFGRTVIRHTALPLMATIVEARGGKSVNSD